jgi:outer membrane protein TolC
MSIQNLNRLILALGLLYLSCLPTHGQELSFHNLEEVLRYAKANAPDQKIRDLQVIQQGYAPKMSRAELLPSLRAYGTWDNYLQLPVQLLPSEAVGGEPGTFTEIRFGTQYQLSLGMEASLPLFDLELWNKVKADRLRSQATLHDLATQEQAWAEEIAKAYYQLLLHRESLLLAEERFQLSDSIYRLASLTYQVGEMEPLPFQRIKATAQSAQQALTKQKKMQDLAKSALLRLIGGAESEVEFAEDLKLPNTEGQEADYALSSLAEWKKAEFEVATSEQVWKQSLASQLPKLTGNGRFYQQTLANNFNLTGASSFEVGVIGLSLNWNLFQGNLKRLKTKSAHLDWQIAREQQLLTQVRLSEEQSRLQAELVTNQRLVKDFDPLLRLFADNFRLAGLQWAAGHIPADELLQVEREWIEQQQDYLIALSDLFTSKALLFIRNQSYSENP